MTPTSPQMVQALADMREWRTTWVRHRDGRRVYWKPARWSTEPPTISHSTMMTLCRRGYVRGQLPARGVGGWMELAEPSQ